MATTTGYLLKFDGREHVFDDDIEIAEKTGFCVGCPQRIEKGDRIRFGHYGPHRQDYSKIHDKCFIEEAHLSGYTLPEDRAIEAITNGEVTVYHGNRATEAHMEELPKGSYAHRNKYAIYIGDKFLWATSDLRRAEGAVAVLQLLDLERLF